eukprot:122573-Chlamydomonas_euryale.AAC.3
MRLVWPCIVLEAVVTRGAGHCHFGLAAWERACARLSSLDPCGWALSLWVGSVGKSLRTAEQP